MSNRLAVITHALYYDSYYQLSLMWQIIGTKSICG